MLPSWVIMQTGQMLSFGTTNDASNLDVDETT